VHRWFEEEKAAGIAFTYARSQSDQVSVERDANDR
jgi:hypothetical protein